MPQAPSRLRILPDAQDDLEDIKQSNPDDAQRCYDAITDWGRKIQWDRVPQNHLRYLTGSGTYNFYRQWVGNSDYRIVYDIRGGLMTAVAVFGKDDNAYDLGEFQRRMDRA